MADHLIATENLHVATADGTPRTIYAGTALPADDPIVKASPERFKTAEELAAGHDVQFDAQPAEEEEPTPEVVPSDPEADAGDPGVPSEGDQPDEAPADEVPASEPDAEGGPLTTEDVPAGTPKRTKRS